MIVGTAAEMHLFMSLHLSLQCKHISHIFSCSSASTGTAVSWLDRKGHGFESRLSLNLFVYALWLYVLSSTVVSFIPPLKNGNKINSF